jgi:4-hydroxy-2-oxoheptanedioate aldolase
MKNLKKRLQRDETLLGCWLNLGSSVTAEIVGLAGFDWVLIDLEHGSGTDKDLLFQLQALEHTHAASLVRIESFERQRIHRVLDIGAEGIMCPRIKNVEEAKLAAGGMRYSTKGIRGVAKMVRATNFGRNFDQYLERGQEEIVGIVQIETRAALEQVDQIAAVEGIDVLFIGPADLSMELGIFGKFNDPRFKDAVEKIINAARKHGKAAGILLPDIAYFKPYHEMGMRFFGCGSDSMFVADGAFNTFSGMNELRSSGNLKIT